MGRPDTRSTPLAKVSPAPLSPRTPCSGARSRRRSPSAASRSTVDCPAAVRPEGAVRRAMRPHCPAWAAVKTSMPNATMCLPSGQKQRFPSRRERVRLK